MYPHSHQVEIDFSHSHTFTGTAESHTHTFTGSSATTSSSGSHTHTVSGLYKGTTATYSTNYTSGRVSIEEDGSYVTSSAGSHTHTLTAKGTNSSTSITPAGTISDYTSQKILATLKTGGGQAHNNMPPYVTKYVWERVA